MPLVNIAEHRPGKVGATFPSGAGGAYLKIGRIRARGRATQQKRSIGQEKWGPLFRPAVRPSKIEVKPCRW